MELEAHKPDKAPPTLRARIRVVAVWVVVGCVLAAAVLTAVGVVMACRQGGGPIPWPLRIGLPILMLAVTAAAGDSPGGGVEEAGADIDVDVDW
ncbi:hypothetical protein [Nonomuraea sp. NPDC001023]|uniref:hypothetical protein n=1 Tax=unclassified Nonomuraea TaxID=2593643 RepID=UPI003334647D